MIKDGPSQVCQKKKNHKYFYENIYKKEDSFYNAYLIPNSLLINIKHNMTYGSH